MATPEQARQADLVFLLDSRWKKAVLASAAQVVLLPEQLWSDDFSQKYCLRVKEVRAALAQLLRHFHPTPTLQPGIHPTAVLGSDCRIATSAQIGAYCVLGDRVEVGAHSILAAHVCVGTDSVIGTACRLGPHVTLYDHVTLADRVIVHAGAVIGSDGYGFYPLDGEHHKIPQSGGVNVEADVEIGAGTTIDRGTVGNTRIGQGTKIDNQVQIGHNVQIGKHCLIVAQTGIAGSAILEDAVTLAGQTGVAGHIRIGKGVIAAGKSGITRDLPPHMKVSGFPAQAHAQELKQQALLRRLPALLAQRTFKT